MNKTQEDTTTWKSSRQPARSAVGALLFAAAASVALVLGAAPAGAQATVTAADGSTTGSTSEPSSTSAPASGTDGTTTTPTTAPPKTTTISSSVGEIVIVDQNAKGSNKGTAGAGSGDTTITGNGSQNDGVTAQGSAITLAGGVQDASTTNDSSGIAGITTGDATATGNVSDTSLEQNANVTAGGRLGGIIIIRQSADVRNIGTADANTGRNNATGNGSQNSAETSQNGNGTINNGSTSNSSDGSAGVETGDANATGNSSTTNVSQIATATLVGALGGIIIIDQSVRVANKGDAEANTGRNVAVGNGSENESQTEQDAASSRGPPGAVNIADTTNTSDGTAGITTGNATATGNRSDTVISQTANATILGQAGGFVIGNQNARVTNEGSATANTGENRAIGNRSDNDASTEQSATNGGGKGNGAAVNIGTSSNESNGTANIDTGNATATGNVSRTVIDQQMNLAIPAMGFYLGDQAAKVTNEGTAVANTGDNLAVGNESENEAETDQDADASAGKGGIATNIGTTRNESDGSAEIVTGNADAVGNDSVTIIGQQLNLAPYELGFTLVDGGATVANRGDADANTGRNDAFGNRSTNEASVDQEAEAGNGNGVLANLADTSNSSDGTAGVRTGNASAIGNRSETHVLQAVNPGITTVVPAPDVVTPVDEVEAPAAPAAEQLPVTGGSLETQAALGLLLVGIGAMLRRNRQMA